MGGDSVLFHAKCLSDKPFQRSPPSRNPFRQKSPPSRADFARHNFLQYKELQLSRGFFPTFYLLLAPQIAIVRRGIESSAGVLVEYQHGWDLIRIYDRGRLGYAAAAARLAGIDRASRFQPGSFRAELFLPPFFHFFPISVLLPDIIHNTNSRCAALMKIFTYRNLTAWPWQACSLPRPAIAGRNQTQPLNYPECGP